MKFFLTAILFLHILVCFSQVQTAFLIKDKELIPEGIAYDPVDRSFFVSSIFKKKIVKVSAKGQVTDFISSGQDGIGEVLGMKVDNGKRQIWACSNLPGKSMVHQFDLSSGKLVRKFEWLEKNHLFNDLTITKAGVFVTDSNEGAVYKIDPDHPVPALFLRTEETKNINGIDVRSDGKLILSGGTNVLLADTQSKEIQKLKFPGYVFFGFDGLYCYKNSIVGVQNITFPVSVNQFKLDPSGKMVEQAKNLAVNHPEFYIPTTGVIVDDWFFFIANSHVDNVSNEKIIDPAKLEDVIVLKVKLENW